ncbi:hypothetical protein V8C86DRAFT_242564 [Haematococcus lacustris]
MPLVLQRSQQATSLKHLDHSRSRWATGNTPHGGRQWIPAQHQGQHQRQRQRRRQRGQRRRRQQRQAQLEAARADQGPPPPLTPPEAPQLLGDKGGLRPAKQHTGSLGVAAGAGSRGEAVAAAAAARGLLQVYRARPAASPRLQAGRQQVPASLAYQAKTASQVVAIKVSQHPGSYEQYAPRLRAAALTGPLASQLQGLLHPTPHPAASVSTAVCVPGCVQLLAVVQAPGGAAQGHGAGWGGAGQWEGGGRPAAPGQGDSSRGGGQLATGPSGAVVGRTRLPPLPLAAQPSSPPTSLRHPSPPEPCGQSPCPALLHITLPLHRHSVWVLGHTCSRPLCRTCGCAIGGYGSWWW